MPGLFEYLPVVHTIHVHDHIVQLEVIPVWVVPLYDKWCVFYMINRWMGGRGDLEIPSDIHGKESIAYHKEEAVEVIDIDTPPAIESNIFLACAKFVGFWKQLW